MDIKKIESQIKDLTRQLVEVKFGGLESMVGHCFEDSDEDSYSWYFVRKVLSTGYLQCFYFSREIGGGEITIDQSYVVQPSNWWMETSKKNFLSQWERIVNLDPFKV